MLQAKNKDGNYTNKRPDIIKVATDYYRNLYQSKKKISQRNETDDESIPKILLKETIRAINIQKRGKEPGTDQITNEILIANGPRDSPYINGFIKCY